MVHEWLKLEKVRLHLEQQERIQQRLRGLESRFPAEQIRINSLLDISLDLEADTLHLYNLVYTRVYFEDLVDEPNPFETEEHFAREQDEKNGKSSHHPTSKNVPSSNNL